MSLKKNVIANYLGQGWTSLMNLVFIPLYIQYLGVEAYGLIGVFVLLQTWLQLLDMGMTPTVSREMARYKGGVHSSQSIRDLLRTVETMALLVAGLIASSILISSEWLAKNWLHVEAMPLSLVVEAFSIMGVVTGFRFVENIYRSSLVGLQRQTQLNMLTSLMATLRGGGAVSILAWISPTLYAFFLWQGLISLLTIVSLALITYHALPSASRRGRFSLDALMSIWRYAGGILGITVLSLLLMQVDKLILSRLLTLKEFGYYSLAVVVAGGINILGGPIIQAWSPRLCEVVACGDQYALSATYHKGAQAVTVVVGSTAIIIIACAETILRLWTGDVDIATKVAPIVQILALGNMLNAMMWIPYQTQLAYGWTELTIKVNTVSVALLVPAVLWIAPVYGPVGAAWIWVILNAGYFLIGVHFMYRKIVTTEKLRWYFCDVIFPLIAGSWVVIIARKIPFGFESSICQVVEILALLALSLLMITCAAILFNGRREKKRLCLKLN
ncbi:MAG: oligosaccharide flippase family protein [Methylococcus sp.]|nr:oligosaccharide flippase family protein [Methylococcus sp.]